ncbi:MAG: hypothetical protein ACRDR6_06675 [Pseudonocardiaceae bacterium]
MGVVDALRRWERRSRPVDPEFAAALHRRWAELPEHVKTPGQVLGRHAVGCKGTHGVFPRCDLACTPCYHSRGTNQVRVDEAHPVAEVGKQLALLRRLRGPSGSSTPTGSASSTCSLAWCGTATRWVSGCSPSGGVRGGRPALAGGLRADRHGRGMAGDREGRGRRAGLHRDPARRPAVQPGGIRFLRRPQWHPFLSGRDPRDLDTRDAFLRYFSGVNFTGVAALELAGKLVRSVARHPVILVIAARWVARTLRRIGGARALLRHGVAPVSFVVHQFMDAADVAPAWELMRRGEKASDPRRPAVLTYLSYKLKLVTSQSA